MVDANALKLLQWNLQHQGRADEMRKAVGNAFWNYQHTLAEWIPPEPAKQKAAFENLVSNVANFPCPNCAEKGLMYLKSNPIDLKKEDFAHYVWRFHNVVNQKLGKPQFPFPEEVVPKPSCVPKHVIERFIEMGESNVMDKVLADLPVCET